MITLRDMVKQDRAIAAVSKDECLMLAVALATYSKLLKHWLFKYLLPKDHRKKVFELEMLTAVFGRTSTFVEPSKPVQLQIAKAMEAANYE